MKAFLRAHQHLLVVGAACFLALGGSGYYLLQGIQDQEASLKSLEEVNAKLRSVLSKTPTPSEENLKRLQKQQEEINVSVERLTEELRELDVSVRETRPSDFQQEMKDRQSSVKKLAETNAVVLPEGFYLGFDKYTSAIAKEKAAPYLARQLRVANLILEQLIRSIAAGEVKAFTRSELEAEREPSAQPKEATPPKDTGKEKSKGTDRAKQEVQPSLLTGEFFDVQFMTRPANLRDFLNGLVAERSCILVVRTLKIENERPKAPSKRPPDAAVPLAAGGPSPANLTAPATTLTGLLSSVAPNAKPIAGALPLTSNPQPSAPLLSEGPQVLLGDEKIEVTMRIEFVSFLGDSLPRQ